MYTYNSIIMDHAKEHIYSKLLLILCFNSYFKGLYKPR